MKVYFHLGTHLKHAGTVTFILLKFFFLAKFFSCNRVTIKKVPTSPNLS